MSANRDVGNRAENQQGLWWLPLAHQRITGQLQEFMRLEASGGIALLFFALISLVWVNTFTGSYHDVWSQELTIGFGPFEVAEPLEGWVNDALMAIFFFVVGLEIKREIVFGELQDAKRASLPIIAAVGGMVVPALIFLRFNAGHEGADGFGIPVATDIAFAMGVLAVIGRRIPSGLRLFLLTLAVADDIGGIAIIAVFYSEDISLLWLPLAVGALGVVVIMQRLGIAKEWPYVLVGIAVWYAAFRSGVHATIAGVVLGLLTPARPIEGKDVLRNLEHQLHPWTAFAILPVFALANAGIEITSGSLEDAFTGRLAWGVMLGLLVGKAVGISAATFGAVWLGAGRLPDGVATRHVVGAALLGGIGFTVALFIATLSFAEEPELLGEAKLGVFAGSLIAGILGSTVLMAGSRPAEAMVMEEEAAAPPLPYTVQGGK